MVVQISMALTVILSLVSIAVHGLLPSVFTVVVVNSGISIMNFTIWGIIQVHSTIRVLVSSANAWWHWGLIPILSYITYHSPYHGCSLIALLLAIVWAVKVYQKIHVVVDPFVATLLTFVLLCGIAKAVKCGDIIDVYSVGLKTTKEAGGQLNIYSQIANANIQLRPKGPEVKVIACALAGCVEWKSYVRQLEERSP